MAEATLYIPTYRRPEKQVTWRSVSAAWRQHTALVAYPEEADTLRAKGYPVRETQQQVRGISHKRQWILDQHSIERDGQWAIMADDDFQFATRRTDEPTKFTAVRTDEEFDTMMGMLLTLMRSGVALGGIDPRGGANRRTPPVVHNARLHGVMAVDVAVARRIGARLDRTEFMEDFDFVLQFLTKGYPQAAISTHCWSGMNTSNAPGGCQTYRTKEKHAASALALAERYPEFVTPVERKSKNWDGGMETRLDVRISWKKAYEAGRLGRDLLGLPQEQPDFSALELL